MTPKQAPAGYVPGIANADGSEDPAPTPVLHSTEAASAPPPSKAYAAKIKVASENDKSLNNKHTKKRN